LAGSLLALVGLGDFSRHIAATQVVLALFIGVLLRDHRLSPYRHNGSYPIPVS